MTTVFSSVKRAGLQGQTCNEKYFTIGPGKARKREAQQALAKPGKSSWLDDLGVIYVCDVGERHI